MEFTRSRNMQSCDQCYVIDLNNEGRHGIRALEAGHRMLGKRAA